MSVPKGFKEAFRKLIVSAFALLILLSYLHISTTVEEHEDDSCPYAIRIDGVNYIYGGAQRPELSDEDVDILGKVRRISVPLNRMPEKDRQANFSGAAGAPFGIAPDGEYVFFYDGCWRPLRPEGTH